MQLPNTWLKCITNCCWFSLHGAYLALWYIFSHFPDLLWYCYAYKGQIAKVHIAMTELAVEKVMIIMCKTDSLRVLKGVFQSPLIMRLSILCLQHLSHLSFPYLPWPPFQEPHHHLAWKIVNIFLIISHLPLIPLKALLLNAARLSISNSLSRLCSFQVQEERFRKGR